MTGRESLSVAVVGVTGAAGSTVLRILEERRFPVGELRALASARSAGRSVRFAGRDVEIAEATPEAVRGADVCFLAAGASTARNLAPVVAATGGIAIDKSSAYRADPAVPLVVPEVNAGALERHRGIVANPNCVAVPLTVALAPLHRAFGLKRITVSTYQSASGAGRNLADELRAQQLDDARGEEPVPVVYPHVLHGNVVPGGWTMEGDDSEEELKVVAEVRKVLELPALAISVTTVRVPVAIGHSAAVWAEFDGAVDPAQARRLLAQAAGVLVVDDPAAQAYPTPLQAAGQDLVLVGRIREDIGRPGAIALFLCVDNLRKGAATNAVQVGELVVQRLGAAAR
jgi:aspartate-semialdehyde dehydrogenase